MSNLQIHYEIYDFSDPASGKRLVLKGQKLKDSVELNWNPGPQLKKSDIFLKLIDTYKILRDRNSVRRIEEGGHRLNILENDSSHPSEDLDLKVLDDPENLMRDPKYLQCGSLYLFTPYLSLAMIGPEKPLNVRYRTPWTADNGFLQAGFTREQSQFLGTELEDLIYHTVKNKPHYSDLATAIKEITKL